MSSCLIGLGSNLGDRPRNLQQAVARLDAHPQIALAAVSRWHETPPIGGPAGQAAFFNGAVRLETSLAPEALLAELQAIEDDLGRQRLERWGPRTVDLDLLLFDRHVTRSPSLEVPHPRMAWRRFVLEPAVEVASEMVHPVIGWTVAQLLAHLDTTLPYLAIAGSIGAGKTLLAERLVADLPARLIPEPIDAAQLATFYSDPSGNAWPTELEFLRQRSRQLDAELPEWSDRTRWSISDFWFDQSPAFARVWLSAEQFQSFEPQWRQAKAKVVRPRLLVLLTAPADELLRRVQRRGRDCERDLTARQLDRIAQAIARQAERPDQGPVMTLEADDPDRVFKEVVAAVRSM